MEQKPRNYYLSSIHILTCRNDYVALPLGLRHADNLLMLDVIEAICQNTDLA